MPLPRFRRLAPERQQAILRVARTELARRGPAGFSYASFIEKAGISKTCAYLYFDGKDDLTSTVTDDVANRMREIVGPWKPAGSRSELFRALETASTRLHRHLVAHRDDLAVLAMASGLARVMGDWFEAVVEDGVRLGVIRSNVPRDLMVAATRAVIAEADQWSIARLQRGEEVDPCEAAQLLKGLWQTPTGR